MTGVTALAGCSKPGSDFDCGAIIRYNYRMKLDFTPFEKALLSLERAVVRATAAPEDEELRDAVIQRFEYSMDLSWKFIQRALKHAAIPESNIRTKRDLFREAARLGLLADPLIWFGYYEARNETSHTYAREVAERVSAAAQRFLPQAQALLEALRTFADA
ncbi:MAG TPA: nucleotidyltransferase substrate binding protein [Dissulfurispiraceae bacterium]|nr:nucleotidyltransferase substrate binding protein [Dissulfurispiraceae bacterium]